MEKDLQLCCRLCNAGLLQGAACRALHVAAHAAGTTSTRVRRAVWTVSFFDDNQGEAECLREWRWRGRSNRVRRRRLVSGDGGVLRCRSGPSGELVLQRYHLFVMRSATNDRRTDGKRCSTGEKRRSLSNRGSRAAVNRDSHLSPVFTWPPATATLGPSESFCSCSIRTAVLTRPGSSTRCSRAAGPCREEWMPHAASANALQAR